MKKELNKKVVDRLMDRALEIHRQCPEECRDFRIMVSPMREHTMLLRWLSIDISDIEKPYQCFRYECFNLDGTPQNCSVNYSDQQEANEFFCSLKTLYKQNFVTDHIKSENYVPDR